MEERSSVGKPQPQSTEMTRYQFLPSWLKIIVIVLVSSGLIAFLMYLFGWTIRGWALEEVRYYYLLYVTFGTCAFILMPARKKDRNKVRWYDISIAALLFSICLYCVFNSYSIAVIGWVPPRNNLDLVLGIILVLIALECGRRVGGWTIVILSVLFGAYPLFADRLPGILYGFSFPFKNIVGTFAYGKLGMLGMPAQVTGDILLGFLIFAGVLLGSGAGKFFLDVSLALLGRFRGGSAKVAVLASGLFGMLNGAVVANIVATGSFTIPSMKKTGYPPYYAAAISAVASSGGSLMPPVMGMIVFVMVILTGIPYAEICIAAFLPAVLYYFGVYMQVDAYAASKGLVGLPREQLPSLWGTIKDGWTYIIVLLFLVFGLLYMRWGTEAAVYSAALLLLLSFVKRETRVTPKRFIGILASIGNLVTYMVAILLPIGLVMIGLQSTGWLTSLTAEIINLGGESVFIILLVTMTICYVFGMVGMVLIPYVVLAVTVVPALVTVTGMNIMALHLFIIWFINMWGITPPVAVAAFVAAAIAGAPPMKTGYVAMRLAVVLYFVPYLFVFSPALIMQGAIFETIYLFILCIVAIILIAGAFEGYIPKLGKLPVWPRPLFVIGGFLLPLPWWLSMLSGAVVIAFVIAILLITRRTKSISSVPKGIVQKQ